MAVSAIVFKTIIYEGNHNKIYTKDKLKYGDL